MEEHYPVAYNLGSGRAHWDGWINVDMHYGVGAEIIADVRQLPMIETETADAAAAIHILEHFYRWEVPGILQEWRRILKVGGKLIVEVPCMDKVFGYVAGAVQKRENLSPFMTLHALWGDPKHENPAMVHKWGYFIEELTGLLKAAGFRKVDVFEPRYHFQFRDIRCEAIK